MLNSVFYGFGKNFETQVSILTRSRKQNMPNIPGTSHKGFMVWKNMAMEMATRESSNSSRMKIAIRFPLCFSFGKINFHNVIFAYVRKLKVKTECFSRFYLAYCVIKTGRLEGFNDHDNLLSSGENTVPKE